MNIIYYLCGKVTRSFQLKLNGVKIGSTKNIISRMKYYKTCYADEIPLKCYYEINKNCYYVDELLKKTFSSTLFISNGSKGGHEFYNSDIITEQKLEQFFIINEITFTKKYFDDFLQEEIKKPITNDDLKNIYNDIEETNKDIRTKLQDLYQNDIIYNLNEFSKVISKAPTGFGKTIINFKIINYFKPKRVLIFTPRKKLNKQSIAERYTKFIINNSYYYEHFSEMTKFQKETYFKNFDTNKNIIITSCYQSGNLLANLINQHNIIFDLVIFDEAHFIDSWTDETNGFKHYLLNTTLIKNRIFSTATPTEKMIIQQNIFGQIIENVKIFELINQKILCDFETIVKVLDEKSDLSKLIQSSMVQFNKKKGIIYVNNSTNAENLYKLLKKNTNINTYIYISKDIKTIPTEHKSIDNFENDTEPSVIISIEKISYGYDNDMVDFICFGDSRQSDISIRQILGRGLRWNKEYYPNKILHVLVPLYKNNITNNEHYVKFLDYIIGECGKEIIIKNNNNKTISNNRNEISKSYDGINVPVEILEQYCTTRYNMWSRFKNFLKENNVVNPDTYNIIQETNTWMPIFSIIRDKYPKFCFRDIHPNNVYWYWTKQEAEYNYNKYLLLLGDTTELTQKKILELIHNYDNKIPLCDLDTYYPI